MGDPENANYIATNRAEVKEERELGTIGCSEHPPALAWPCLLLVLDFMLPLWA